MRNALLTAGGVVVSLAVVAIAARESTSSGSGAARRPSDTLIDIFLTLYVVTLVAGALFFLYLLALRRKLLVARPEDMHRRDIRNAIGTFLFIGLALLFARTLGERQAGPEITIPPAPAIDPGAAQAEPGKEIYEPEFAWIPVLVTLALVLLAVFGWWWADRARRRARGELGDGLAEAMAAAVDESLDDLRAETDPRRAVIAAYARLEQVLASHGLPRDPAEAPLEYLRRMLAELSVSPPAARRLTELFERAKFSQHAVGPEMKEQAIRALEVVRDDLRAARERAEAERAAAIAALAQPPVSR